MLEKNCIYPPPLCLGRINYYWKQIMSLDFLNRI